MTSDTQSQVGGAAVERPRMMVGHAPMPRCLSKAEDSGFRMPVLSPEAARLHAFGAIAPWTSSSRSTTSRPFPLRHSSSSRSVVSAPAMEQSATSASASSEKTARPRPTNEAIKDDVAARLAATEQENSRRLASRPDPLVAAKHKKMDGRVTLIPDEDYPDGNPLFEKPSRRYQLRSRSLASSERDGDVAPFTRLPEEWKIEKRRTKPQISEIGVWGHVGSLEDTFGLHQPRVGVCKCSSRAKVSKRCPLHMMKARREDESAKRMIKEKEKEKEAEASDNHLPAVPSATPGPEPSPLADTTTS